MSEGAYYTKLQAIIQSMIEDSVNFEEQALEEVGGKKIHAFINRGPRTVSALNDQYILGLIKYIEEESGEYTLSNLDFLADYIMNKYPLRAKIKDFMAKIREALSERF